VLRFDYLGTEFSLFAERDDAVDNWLHSVDHAIAYLLEIGAQSITAMGSRRMLDLNRALAILVESIGRVRGPDRDGRRYLP